MSIFAPSFEAHAGLVPDNNGHMSWTQDNGKQANAQRRTASHKRIRQPAAMEWGEVQERTQRAPRRERSTAGTITVPTAANIDVTVSSDFAPKIQGFIAANVAKGKRFSSIHCLSFASTRVSGSAHFTGDACDFKPRPIGSLAGDFGLRNGCSFMVGKKGHRHPDCMHIDNRLAYARR